MTQNSYLHHFSAQVSQIVFLSLFDRFTSLLQLYESKSQQTRIYAISVQKYNKSFS